MAVALEWYVIKKDGDKRDRFENKETETQQNIKRVKDNYWDPLAIWQWDNLLDVSVLLCV